MIHFEEVKVSRGRDSSKSLISDRARSTASTSRPNNNKRICLVCCQLDYLQDIRQNKPQTTVVPIYLIWLRKFNDFFTLNWRFH